MIFLAINDYLVQKSSAHCGFKIRQFSYLFIQSFSSKGGTGVKIEPKNGLDHPALLPVSQLKLFDCQKNFIVVLEWHFVIMVVTL